MFLLDVHHATLSRRLFRRLRLFVEECVRSVLVVRRLLLEVVALLCRILLVWLNDWFFRNVEQILRCYLKRSEVLLVELGVVGVAELLAEQRQVHVADYYLSTLAHELHQLLLLLQLACVLQCLVVVAETLHEHTVQSVHLLHLYVEVAHHERCEVVAGQLEEHTVGVYRVGLVRNHVYERSVAVVRELAHRRRVAFVEHLRASLPDVLEVELAALQLSSLVHALHYHACHYGYRALRILLHHRVQIVDTALVVAVVQLAESADEEELVAVGTQREPLFRHADIAAHLLIARRLERIVCSGVQRVFEVHAETCVLYEVGVGEQCCPLALGVLLLESCHVRVGGLSVALAHI